MDEVVLVATDRYRLSVRILQPRGFSGVRRSPLVPATELSELSRWAAGSQLIQFDLNADRATATTGDERRVIPTLEADYPDYRAVLDGVGLPVTRVIVDRIRLLDRVVDGNHPVVCLTTGEGHVMVSSQGGIVQRISRRDNDVRDRRL